MTEKTEVDGQTFRTSGGCGTDHSSAVGSESLDVVLVAFDDDCDVVDAITDSVRILPPGFLTVPYIAPGTPLADARAQLEDERINVVIADTRGCRQPPSARPPSPAPSCARARTWPRARAPSSR